MAKKKIEQENPDGTIRNFINKHPVPISIGLAVLVALALWWAFSTAFGNDKVQSPYYYSNDNGSTYYNNGSGGSRYTAPSGKK